MSAYKFNSKPFYSNCFFEAVKAKIKNFKEVSIKYIPPRLNCEGLFGHFYWIKKGDNKVYEFSNIEMKKKGVLYPFFFKGHIMESNKGRNETILNMNIHKRIKKIEKKYGFISYATENENKNNKYSWKLYDKSISPSFFIEDNPYHVVLGLYKDGEENKLALYQVDKVKGLINPKEDDILYYKLIDYINPL